MSFVIKQPFYNRFSLDRQCSIAPLSYHSPPSLHFQPVLSLSKHNPDQSPHLKQKMYLTFSKPPHPVTDQ